MQEGHKSTILMPVPLSRTSQLSHSEPSMKNSPSCVGATPLMVFMYLSSSGSSIFSSGEIVTELYNGSTAHPIAMLPSVPPATIASVVPVVTAANPIVEPVKLNTGLVPSLVTVEPVSILIIIITSWMLSEQTIWLALNLP